MTILAMSERGSEAPTVGTLLLIFVVIILVFGKPRGGGPRS